MTPVYCKAELADTLRLITCLASGYVGPAPNRFVVRARELEMIR
jgi:hypothetical protein